MNNNKIVKKPLIFDKKSNDNYRIIPLNESKSTLGPMRYFPIATQEWYNSIYVYNNNNIKHLIIANKNLSKLIKSYFNFYYSKKIMVNKPVNTRLKRLAIKKIFVSKTELKHTNSKVIITLYVYNEERRILINKIKRIEVKLFSYINNIQSKIEKNRILSLKDKLSLIKNQIENISFENVLENLNFSILEEKKSKSLKMNVLEKNLEDINNIIINCKENSVFYEQYKNIYNEFMIKRILEKEILIISYYKLLLNLNKSKFEDKLLFNLKALISKIYNKEVCFNIINQKSVYLNSDIFTQVIALKLKNRKNRLLKVLRSFIYMVKLPKVNTIKERFGYINIKNLWNNRVKNLKINYLLDKNKDSFNQLLYGLFINFNFLNKNIKTFDCYYKNTNLINYILNDLKYKSMAGVRLEAKGRLTKRFTASRSLFKIKWKGSLKNIDSSYRGLSSVLLRGYVKSNVQYSITNSKTRNGAFGIKGWISGK